jgi:hypothetical protein
VLDQQRRTTFGLEVRKKRPEEKSTFKPAPGDQFQNGPHKGALLAYRDWPKLREPPESVSVENWPIGQSGILYPVSPFAERIFDPMAGRLSPSAVEPWFHLNLQLTTTPGCVVGRKTPRLHKFKDCLWKINLIPDFSNELPS